MSYHDDEEEVQSDNIVDVEILHENTLFEGDQGTLPAPARHVLVRLLIGPHIDAKRQEKLWHHLKKYKADIQVSLANLFLSLVIDDDLGVAFTRQMEATDVEIPKLLRRTKLSFLESVLLLFLREKLNAAEGRGERAVVGQEEMQQFLQSFDKGENKDAVVHLKHTNAAIDKVKKYNFLVRIRATDQRFEISPVLKVIFNADEVYRLSLLYQKILNQTDLPIEKESSHDSE